MKEQRHLRIHGKVQGVGYRFYATRVARRMGLKGWIQNNRDGSVEALVEGEKKSIDEWIDQESKEFSGKLPDFDVKF
jgi:acylphosphatase